MSISVGRKRPLMLAFGATLLALTVSYVVASFEWRAIGRLLRDADLAWVLGISALTIFVYWLIRAARWAILLRAAGVHIPFAQLYLWTAITVGLAIVTPFQLGELLKVELLKRSGQLARLPGYGTFLIERAADLGTVVILSVTSLVVVLGLPDFGAPAFLLLVGSATVAIVATVALVVSRRPTLLARFLLQVGAILADTRALSLVILLTFLAWLAAAVGWYASLRGVGVEIGAIKTVALLSTATMINVLSFVPGALGVSEVGVSELLFRFGVGTVEGQAGAIAVRIYGLLAVFLGACHFVGWFVARRFAKPPCLRPAPK